MQDKKSHLTTTSLAVSFSHWKKIMSATYHVYLRYHVYTGYVYVHPNRHRCTWKGEAEWKHLYHWNYVIDRTGFFAFLMFSLQINSPVVHRSILGYSQWFLRTAKSQNQNGNMSKCVRFVFFATKCSSVTTTTLFIRGWVHFPWLVLAWLHEPPTPHTSPVY